MEAIYRDRAVYLPDADALVVADLHVGKAAASSVQLDLRERETLLERLTRLWASFEPAETVVAGDLLHAFSTVPRGVPETLDALRERADTAGTELVVTPGNHDTLLGELWDSPLESEYRLGDAVVCHGHDPPETDAAWYVVGHDHPAIDIEGRKRPCYLTGESQYRDRGLVMLPSFSPLAAGRTINRLSTGDFLSPLVTDVNALCPVVRDEDGDQTLEFPPLGEFRRLL
ncbi:metallophosphoesterase [Natronomonas sp. EA1]|uniref:metallophosphoesterase n=1 Tax=Natronomonas sp. EA1 TaxID=3421655 RepID=UPI003EBCDC54